MLSGVRVRNAEVTDVGAMAQVMAIVAEEGSIGTEPPVDVDELAQRFRRTLESPGNSAVWVLEESGRVLGHASARDTGAPGVQTLGMIIVPEGRGRGGGRALLDEAIQHARDCRAHKLELEVWPDNARAIALYARVGFEVEGYRRDHYRRRDGTLRSTLLMALLLADR